MLGIDDAIAGVSNLADTIVKTIWPNPADQANAHATMIKATVEAKVKELEAAQAVMLAEASSTDKWTSRARPSFLYVVYVLILWSIPMGVLFVIAPDTAGKFTTGFAAWLNAIPDPYIKLFGFVMGGYIVGRSYEKTKGVN